MDLTPFGKPAAKSVPLPARFWEELDQAAGVNLARAQGNLSVPAYLATAPERGVLAAVPAEQGQALVGQARAFVKSDFSYGSARGEQVAKILDALPGGPAADAAERKAAAFLENFDQAVQVRAQRQQGNFAIPAFKGAQAETTLQGVPSAEAAGLLNHFQAFLDSPHGASDAGDRTLLADLQKETGARTARESLQAIQVRPAIADRSKEGSYSLTPEREF
ncbi:MAG: hypothetical protein PW734_02060 [Verrucomicrobium sp.]|nr:hypothetical protein [Verrucomicrobium sp.]